MVLLMKIKQIIKQSLAKKRQRKFKQVNILNNDVTILSNCCIGGAMYHDLGLRFLSPTINLYFSHHCFIDFINNLETYINCGELIDSGNKELANGAPIGLLVCNGLPTLEIHFLHYSTFDEAKSKWIDRCKRINYKKIFLVIEAKDAHEHSLINEYSSLPYKKIIFTNLPSNRDKCVLNMKFYKRRPKGNITSFVGIGGSKGYDDFDFVEQIFNRQNWEPSFK